MDTVTVSKPKLLETLRTNRDEHRDVFLKAQVAFRAKVIEVLDERLRAARDGRKIDLRIALPEPVDYTEQFDEAIEMVEWEQGDTVELDERDFRRYVLGKWEWAQTFAAATRSYVGG